LNNYKIVRDSTREELHVKEISFFANKDPLTGLNNRRSFYKNANTIFEQIIHSSSEGFIAMIDIDYFKVVNDTYGHDIGDVVLKAVAKQIEEIQTEKCVSARFGGEEFVIVFPKTTSEEAKERVNELIKSFSEKVFYHNGISFSVTFSAGVFMIENEFVTEDEALKNADLSLYEAKNLGRARCECAQLESNSYKKSIQNVSVIDDDIIIRSLLSRMLKSLSFDHVELNIKVFENGPSFLQSDHAKEDVNHFIILDGVMPMMDGIEVLQEIKQGENPNRYKVLMLTGRNSKEEIERALELGVDDYVTKPFYVRDLQERMVRILNQMK